MWGPNSWGGAMLLLALLGTAVAVWRFRQYSTWLLLWVPLLFYSLSIAYGSVPIFIPSWWPFSYYNVRYGLELLPVFAVFPALSCVVCVLSSCRRGAGRYSLWCVLCLLVAGELSVDLCSGSDHAEGGAGQCAHAHDPGECVGEVSGDPATSPQTLLMYQGEHVGALQQAGIPLHNVISEISHPDWEWALLDPAKHADIIVAFKGDPVWMAAHEHRGELIGVVHRHSSRTGEVRDLSDES